MTGACSSSAIFAANQRQQRLDEIAPGILSIIARRETSSKYRRSSFRRILTALIFLFCMQMGFLHWVVREVAQIKFIRQA